ncbi:hypothetical protein [Noviluteimonas gilva]|uniref:Stationary phase growth adaptation protein n=1 Tax=Noviluteimonas gilva TaxID=2682097 RepID=A0A7C9LJX1_9GAMM|nr:hypothetical protein [Lysobacter gilvus]MUV13104.1 hypothetical protein [Lysobacter gilvus]
MATLATGPHWSDHHQDGLTYSVAHLHPVFVDYAIPAVVATQRKPGRAAKIFKLRVVYSHHCFTQAAEKVPGADLEHAYGCTRRPADRRIFCKVRWTESLSLPAIVKGIKHCYFTRHHNYFVWRNPSDIALGEYFVYFTLVRRTAFIEMEIESAYPRNDAAQAKSGAKKVSLATLLINAANGRATHPPPA